jgi:hypothetical protein
VLAAIDEAAAQVPQTELFELIWQETSVLRRAAHNNRACPTAMAPYGPRDPRGARLADACLAAACMDLVHEVYAKVRPKLNERLQKLHDSGKLGEASRYAHTTVRSEIAEMRRRWRVARGLAAKPSRPDGVPGGVITALAERAESELCAQWYKSLFGMIRCYACNEGAPGRSWPLDAWTQEKSNLDAQPRVVGAASSRREISADITWVLATAAEVAGPAWVGKNITASLQISSAHLCLDAIDADHGSQPVVDSPDEMALVGLARSEYTRLYAQRADQLWAMRAALTTVYGIAPQDVSDDAVRRVADVLGVETAA